MLSKQWLETLIGIIIGWSLIGLVIAYRIWYLPDIRVDIDVDDMEQVLDQFKTGDILLIRYNSFYGKLIKLMSGSNWSHCALVYSRPSDGQKLILEMSDYSNYDEIPEIGLFDDKLEDLKGFCSLPLDQWLKLNRKRSVGYRSLIIEQNEHERRFGPTNFKFHKKMDRLIKNFEKKASMDMEMWQWGNSMFSGQSSDYLWHIRDNVMCGKQDYFCSEIVILFLQYLEIIDKKLAPNSYNPIKMDKLTEFQPTITFKIPDLSD